MLISRPASSTRPAPRRRLRVEFLEDRLTPVTFTIFDVTTFADTVDPDDRLLSLREAVDRANARPGPDTIRLRAGVYRLTGVGPSPDDTNAFGDLDVRDTLTIVGRGAGLTAVEGKPELETRERLFDVHGPIDVRFKYLSLRRGGNLDAEGGAVRANVANLRLTGCVVSDNVALSGGGVDAGAGDVTLVNCEVNRNSVREKGGGLYVRSGVLLATNSRFLRNLAGESGGGIEGELVTLVRSTVSGNTASTNGGGLNARTATLTASSVIGNSALGSAPSTGFGGGVDAFSIELTGTVVANNFAEFNGGGVRAQDFATLTRTTVTGNRAEDYGGGVSVLHGSVMTACTVSGNSAGAGNGGIHSHEGINLTDCVVRGNTARFEGGGIGGAAVTLNRCTISGNSAGGEGGGIYATDVTASATTVSGNTAQLEGGGIITNVALLTNCTISGNSAGGDGGGIITSAATLVNVTVTDNRAARGGGLFHFGSSEFRVQNSIIAGNLLTLDGTARDTFGVFTSLGHNLIGERAGGTGFTAAGDLTGTDDDPLDPGLGPLAYNGGPTMTHRLLTASPAIDAGDAPAVDPTGLALLTDQRGRPRRRDGNGDGRAAVDIGALER